MTDPAESPSSVASSASGSRRTSQPCPVHSNKRGDLFCLTCELVICSKCVTDSRKHGRHVVETVKETYTRRFQETQIKLDTLDRYIDAQRHNAELRTRLLEELRENEAALIDRLDQIINEAKAEVAEITNEKAIQLDPLRLTTKLKSYYRDELLTEIASLSDGEFLAQQADLNIRCDSLMSTSVHSTLVAPVDCCNVSCSLLPTIEMDSHCINIASNSSFNISYVDQYGYGWSLELEIKTLINTLPTVCLNKLQLNVKMEGSCKPKGNFQVVLKIVHDLPLKTITQHIPFKSLGPPKSRNISTEIADVRNLRNEGFVTKDHLLQLKLGIGPEDPITERNCYQQILEMHRNKICTLKCELANWKKFNISYFRVEECPVLKSKRSKTKHSTVIMDEHGTKWQLKVSINGMKHKGFIGVFLTKCNGSKGWYDYFIELIHPQSEKHNRIVKGCYLFDVDPLELPQFMTIAFLDTFMDDGTLRLRFGTRKDP
ncbi:uncharacterized protein LOC135708965 [Ochlerotatus camptorhynchus]|uniref:uncharacterized protein LOC135708965 n=1 Tax=Ochlerotatus camptorhynchus TaxID=644619 RepID=UPI0031CDEE3F